jgi:hypothetical protein
MSIVNHMGSPRPNRMLSNAQLAIANPQILEVDPNRGTVGRWN